MNEKNYMNAKERDTDVIKEVIIPVNVTHIAMEIFQNCPEGSISMDCVDWNYGYKDPKKLEGEMLPELFKFTFDDQEEIDDDTDEPKRYVVDIAKAEKGVTKVIELILAEKLFVGGIRTVEDLMELGNWDAEVVDAAIQCAIFGEVIYG